MNELTHDDFCETHGFEVVRPDQVTSAMMTEVVERFCKQKGRFWGYVHYYRQRDEIDEHLNLEFFKHNVVICRSGDSRRSLAYFGEGDTFQEAAIQAMKRAESLLGQENT